MFLSFLKTIQHVLVHPFNRGWRVQAVLRYLRWQCASRLAAGPIIVDFVHPMRLSMTSGMTGATLNLYTGLAEYHDMAFALRLLRPDELFIDIGANVGAYSVLAAASGARVIAVEPATAARHWLALNLRINDIGRQVDIVPAALGRSVGTVRFTANEDTLNHVTQPGDAAQAVEVPVSSLDELLAARGGEGPRLIKIDVEGYEGEVLAGAAATLAAPELLALLVELNGSGARYGCDDAAIIASLAAAGFQPYAYDATARTLTPLAGSDGRANNTLFIRDRAEVERRLQSAPTYLVQGQYL